MKHTRTAFIVLAALVITSCGGSALTTTIIKAEGLRFGTLGTFTVEGPNLDKGITFLAPKCLGVKELEGSTPTVKTYTCTPNVAGTMPVIIIGGQTVLHTTNFEIPTPQVKVSTTLGDMLIDLDPKAAPISVTNFLNYVNQDFYTNLIFHRVVPGFVIQAGGFNADLVAPPTDASIKLEVNNGLSNIRGSVAMARMTELNSGTTQFYINLVDNATLDTVNGGYAVFGSVRAGLAAVDAIGAVPTTTAANGMADVPVTPVVINSIVQTQ
jgi:peptidyl-prolyl cis-trans isomerase A (cyclophilin A)